MNTNNDVFIHGLTAILFFTIGNSIIGFFFHLFGTPDSCQTQIFNMHVNNIFYLLFIIAVYVAIRSIINKL